MIRMVALWLLFFWVIVSASTIAKHSDHHRHHHERVASYFDSLRADIRSEREDIEWLRPLQKWIQMAPLTGEEGAVQHHIAKDLLTKDLQFDHVDLYHMEYDELRAREPELFNPSRSDFSNSPNVVGVKYGSCRGGKTAVELDDLARQKQDACSGRSLILNGHVDVVPIGERTAWKLNDPFSGHYSAKDKTVHGRGSTDMLGGVFSSYLAVKSILCGLNVTLKGDLLFETVVEEESGGAGSLSTAMRGYKADAAIIPEPSDMKIFPKQQGSMWFRITIQGVAAHGGTRIYGVSALEKGVKVVKRVQQLERLRNEKILDEEPLYAHFKDLPKEKQLPVPINMGKVFGGDWPSSVCDKLTIEGRMGVFGEDLSHAQKQLKDALEEVRLEDDFLSQSENSIELEFFGPKWLPGILGSDHEIVTTLSKQYEHVFPNSKPKIESAPWATDAGYLMKVGNTPSIVFGPGTTSLAHQADETVSMEQVLDAAEVIARFIIDWCQIEE